MNILNVALSGISEVANEHLLLLDDIIKCLGEVHEKLRTEKEERTKKDKLLTEAGEEIITSASNRSVCQTTGRRDGKKLFLQFIVQ